MLEIHSLCKPCCAANITCLSLVLTEHGGVGGDGYDTDMDDKIGLARSPSRHPLQDSGLDIQATQAGVGTPAY